MAPSLKWQAFSKLPMVKDAGATPNRPVRLDEEAYTQPEPAPEPKATPKASPTSPPAPSKAARSPKAAAAPEPLPKRSQELASPQVRAPRALWLWQSKYTVSPMKP